MATSTCLAPPGPSARATGRAGTRQNVRAPSGHVRQVLGAELYFGGSATRHRARPICIASSLLRQSFQSQPPRYALRPICVRSSLLGPSFQSQPPCIADVALQDYRCRHGHPATPSRLFS
jgi:hypothetical protein